MAQQNTGGMEYSMAQVANLIFSFDGLVFYKTSGVSVL
jgi:hypothetical protein